MLQPINSKSRKKIILTAWNFMEVKALRRVFQKGKQKSGISIWEIWCVWLGCFLIPVSQAKICNKIAFHQHRPNASVNRWNTCPSQMWFFSGEIIIIYLLKAQTLLSDRTRYISSFSYIQNNYSTWIFIKWFSTMQDKTKTWRMMWSTFR